MNFVNSKKSPLSEKFDVAHGVAGLDAGFRKGRFVLNISKQKHKKFLNFHQNPLENEIIFAKRGIRATSLNPLWIRPCVAPSERNVTLRLF